MSKPPGQKILIAEDEKDVRALVCTALRNAGFFPIEASNGPGALETARKQIPELIVLDLMLPGMHGLDVCKALKIAPETKGIPIIMLTAKAEEVDRIVGLELGADDYMTKPFSPRELILRIQGILRRASGQPEEPAITRMGDIAVDRTQHRVTVNGKPLELTATEFKLLATLIERRGRVQSRDVLLNDVWSYETAIDTRTVDTHVRRLREKLGKAARHIETVRGFGYRMNEAP
jgi:two-component system phosphate regulon response regulator PhoB